MHCGWYYETSFQLFSFLATLFLYIITTPWYQSITKIFSLYNLPSIFVFFSVVDFIFHSSYLSFSIRRIPLYPLIPLFVTLLPKHYQNITNEFSVPQFSLFFLLLFDIAFFLPVILHLRGEYVPGVWEVHYRYSMICVCPKTLSQCPTCMYICLLYMWTVSFNQHVKLELGLLGLYLHSSTPSDVTLSILDICSFIWALKTIYCLYLTSKNDLIFYTLLKVSCYYHNVQNLVM